MHKEMGVVILICMACTGAFIIGLLVANDLSNRDLRDKQITGASLTNTVHISNTQGWDGAAARSAATYRLCSKYGHDYNKWEYLDKLYVMGIEIPNNEIPYTWIRDCRTCGWTKRKESWSTKTPDCTEAMKIVIEEICGKK